MDPLHNPFAPGAGTRPPELAGRQDILDGAELALGRILLRRSARSQMLLGLRGVGKTVLLNRIEEIAAEQGYETVAVEIPENRSLPGVLVPPLRSMLVRLSRTEKGKEAARRGLGVLRSFAAIFRVQVGDVEFGVSPELGMADSGDLDSDLAQVLDVVGHAARAAEKGVALLIDEVQYLSKEDLGALIVGMHKNSQKGLPLVLFGAGLPQLAGLAGEAKSYAERLFEYPEVGPLANDSAWDALSTPIQREGARIDEDAFELIFARTEGYPYFLQEWGSGAWNEAADSSITVQDVKRATRSILASLDRSFFRVRLDRLTPRGKDYLRAMADLGPGPHRSGDIAQKLGIEVTSAGPLRSGLIRKGMIFSPQHGDTAFTVPMFDGFMRRAMPEWKPTLRRRGSKRGKRRKQGE